MSGRSLGFGHTGQGRRFGLLALVLIILIFGLARWEVGLMLIGSLLILALMVLIVFYRSNNRRDWWA